MGDEYEMPKVRKGEVVYWYPHGDKNQEPHVGLVTHVGDRTINVNLAVPNSYNFIIRDGVRHLSDPKVKQAELMENGAWGDTPMRKEHAELLKALERANTARAAGGGAK